MKRIALLMLLTALAACGPQIGSLQKGETGRVVRVFDGDTLQLDSGLRVFLAEVYAPNGKEPYANQSRAELEALALNRTVELAYGGTRRWTPQPRPNDDNTAATPSTTTATPAAAPPTSAAPTTATSTTTPAANQPPRETAIAHIFVQSEGGRWFWLQHALVGKGAVIVRPRRDNNARTRELLDVEAQARAAKRGMWARDIRVLTPQTASRAAQSYGKSCMTGRAPYRLLEATVHQAEVDNGHATLMLNGGSADNPFTIQIFGDSFTQWNGPVLAGLTGAHIFARGTLGVHDDAPQLCLDNGLELTVLRAH